MFDHYNSVVKHVKPAKYLACKKIMQPDKTIGDLQDTLLLHEKLAAEFPRVYNKLLEKSDNSVSKDFNGVNYLEIKKIIVEKMLEKCILCERRCGVNRLKDNIGFCGVNKTARVSSYFLHMGEESQLIPSGTVFFSGCTFRCAYNTCL
ncbi:MAG: hypothetical protein OdinLCB4_004705 [Candidatus Odinarchaeum yellowstonii]|uniref:Uncharacterized protein n=1 Tax=Odinarchaeota yellowstonii (strain LCB_4) TaxID=1841599 RepID=A0AAF0D182_ODILC|nr:MAG: hypothetical protein OdinLCB4_004705 [Candidatus Odinarchaeum yellowstonii]